MAPPIENFHPRRLEEVIQYLPNGHRRKKPVDLKECQLHEMIQYECVLQGPKRDPESRVVCEPLLRLFRKCANGLTIEVTSYEGVYDKK